MSELPEGWIDTTLGEMCIKIGSGATPRGGNETYKSEGTSLIRSQNILDFNFSYNGLAFIDDLQASKLKNVEVMEGDVLINITGDSVARVCRVPKKVLPARVNQHVSILRVNNEKLNSDYLHYYLLNQIFKRHLLALANSGGTRNALTKNMLEILELKLPHLPEQKAIAKLLSSFDEKIELLRTQNETLETLTQTVFIELVINENQNDWENVTLDDISTRITDGSHLSPKTVEVGLPMASVKDMYQWGINNNGCRKISEDDFSELVKADCQPLKNDILIAKDGSYLKHIFLAEKDLDVVILSSIAIIRANNKYAPLLLKVYLTLNSTKRSLKNIVSGAVIPRIVLKDFRKFTLKLPPKEIQDKAIELIQPMHEKCLSNNEQTQTLIKVRDTLLPKLMSGEIRVKGFEQ